MALSTVAEYVAAARSLLADTITDYRYSDADLLRGLNLGLAEARQLRPDLFLETLDDIPSYAAVNSTAVDFDAQYQTALLYYIVGHATLIDAEENQDTRASNMLAAFRNQLTGGR
jgi:hypothetical protein